jgi:3',5'-cyclic AMP phosphodiesterase CpdA
VRSCALHVTDLHAGRRDSPGIGAALAALVTEANPELVIATGDLAHRGRPEQLELARRLLEELGRPFLVVPGNHDLPYSFPARFTRPASTFEGLFGTTEPTYRSETLLVCGLNSSWSWRQQGGRLTASSLARPAEVFSGAAAGALRVVALHHHLAGAPWRASRKFPLRHRDRVLATLAAAGAELVLGGHIHQGSVTTRSEFQVLEPGEHSPVLVTAPGLGRPRPHRAGEAQGAMVYDWDAATLSVTAYVGDGSGFAATGRREFSRR